MHDQESPENLPDEPAAKPADEHAYSVLRNADFSRYLIGRFVASLGQQMLVVAIDWELYRRTHSALALAFVGLSLMVPMILCTIPAGHFADTFSRKKIILIRNEGAKIMHYRLDLSDSKIAGKDYYYILPNDVIVVEPLKAISSSYQNITYTTILSSITTLIAVLLFTNVKF